jgi:hypothetical protein
VSFVCIVTWRLKADIVKSERTAIARQRLVETRFRSNEYSVIDRRVAQRLKHVFMATASNKGMNCCTWCSISGPCEAISGRNREFQRMEDSIVEMLPSNGW